MLKRCVLAIAAILSVVTARADDVADFYKGKQITVIMGYGAGGGYDVYARVIARHIGKYIPGNPTAIVQNMPGAGSMVAANYIYNVAPKNGLVIGSFGRDIPLVGVMGGNAAIQFDPAKFTWLGSPSTYANDAYLLWARDDAPVKTVADARKPGGPPLVIGVSGEGSTDVGLAIMLRDVLGLNLKLIPGYPDGSAISLALERREVDARLLGLSSIYTSHPGWIKPNSGIHPLLQFARKTRHPVFPDAPTARELAQNDRARQLIELAELSFILSRPFVGPPGLPADRAKALQKAFMDMQKGPDYLAETSKAQMDVSPIGGEEAAELVQRLARTPPELFDYMRKLHAGG